MTASLFGASPPSELAAGLVRLQILRCLKPENTAGWTPNTEDGQFLRTVPSGLTGRRYCDASKLTTQQVHSQTELLLLLIAFI